MSKYPIIEKFSQKYSNSQNHLDSKQICIWIILTDYKDLTTKITCPTEVSQMSMITSLSTTSQLLTLQDK